MEVSLGEGPQILAQPLVGREARTLLGSLDLGLGPPAAFSRGCGRG